MRWAELTTGRTFGVSLDDGDDFMSCVEEFCETHDIAQAYMPMFIAGMRNVQLVGTCDRLDDPEAPVWTSVYLENVEAIGCGTIARESGSQHLSLHIHISVGLKAHSATAHTSHLLNAQVRFLTEMYIVEIASPTLRRVRDTKMYDVPLLRYGTEGGGE